MKKRKTERQRPSVAETSADSASAPKVQGVRFVVDESPYCVWDEDIGAMNVEFLRALRPALIDFQAAQLEEPLLQGEDPLAAVAAQITYAHAAESAMALTFAALQAPDAVFAWLARYRVDDIVALCKKVQQGKGIKTRWRAQPKNWSDIARCLLARMPAELTASDGRMRTREAIIKDSARALELIARDFTDDETRDVYNALKHGMRVSVGATSVAFRKESTPGVEDESQPLVDLGSPRGGVGLLALEAVPDQKFHFTVERRFRNWDPVQVVQRLQVASTWMSCVIAGVRAALKDETPPVKWNWFADAATYSEPWSASNGVTAGRMESGLRVAGRLCSKEDILRSYDTSPSSDSPPAGIDESGGGLGPR